MRPHRVKGQGPRQKEGTHLGKSTKGAVGQKFSVRGRGLPSRDDGNDGLFAVSRTAVPAKVTGAEKNVEQLKRESTFNPRI